MDKLIGQFRAVQWWLLPLAVLGLLIGWETEWGRAVHHAVPEPEPIVSTSVSAGVLPEYAIAGGLSAYSETVGRTLFNPTRRPAPTAVPEPPKPRIQRGQFTLTGTTLAGDRNLAFLKEQGGKSRTVKQGDTVNGMLVAEVKPDRVKFTLGDESEEVMLRVATNPKPTPPPAPPAGAAPGAPGVPGEPGAPGTPAAPGQPARPGPIAAQAAAAGQAAPTPPAGTPTPAADGSSGQTLADRRRAARAAEAAAAAAARAARGASGGTDQGWQAVDQRYQQSGGGQGK